MKNYHLSQLTNKDFLTVISRSFEAFLEKGTSRSSDKLKPLHGAIAKDLHERLGENYEIWSQGFGNNKEADIQGRYINKRVDITVKLAGKPVAGIAVKFVMQNYSQNSNNYFENMLGETANIRCSHTPYFQIFIILDKLPYYNKAKNITKWESFTDHNITKYVTLSKDNTDTFLHTPNKTLIYVVHTPEPDKEIKTADEYMQYYRTHNHTLTLSEHQYKEFGENVILNNYETFIQKVYHQIMAL